MIRRPGVRDGSLSVSGTGRSAPATVDVTLASITDGTSNTAISASGIKGKGTTGDGLGRSTWTPRSSTTTPASPAGRGRLAGHPATDRRDLPVVQNLSGLTTKGYSWSDSGCGIGGCYSHIMPPNKRACTYSNLNSGYSASVGYAVGAHDRRQLVPLRAV